MNILRRSLHWFMDATGLDKNVDEGAVNGWMEKRRHALAGVLDDAAGNDAIGERIRDGRPFAAGKIGDVEMKCLCWHLRIRNLYKYTFVPPTFGELELREQAGVFPATEEVYHRFCDLLLERLADLDLAAVWFNPGEAGVLNRHAPAAVRTSLRSLEPYFFPQKPWSAALAGKKVLVIHPFAESIVRQYRQRQAIWATAPDVLPGFDLVTIKAPLGFSVNPFADWFGMLHFLEEQMELLAAKDGFDVALVGCGAAGIPLAVHSKRLGKIGIHSGGPTQLLFGIRGGRWDNRPEFQSLFNDHWIRPRPDETPEEAATVDHGGYW